MSETKNVTKKGAYRIYRCCVLCVPSHNHSTTRPRACSEHSQSQSQSILQPCQASAFTCPPLLSTPAPVLELGCRGLPGKPQQPREREHDCEQCGPAHEAVPRERLDVHRAIATFRGQRAARHQAARTDYHSSRETNLRTERSTRRRTERSTRRRPRTPSRVGALEPPWCRWSVCNRVPPLVQCATSTASLLNRASLHGTRHTPPHGQPLCTTASLRTCGPVRVSPQLPCYVPLHTPHVCLSTHSTPLKRRPLYHTSLLPHNM